MDLKTPGIRVRTQICLGDGENVPFIESQVERRPAMPEGTENHALRRRGRVWHAGVIGGDESGDINQYSKRCGLSDQRAYFHHVPLCCRLSSLPAFC